MPFPDKDIDGSNPWANRGGVKAKWPHWIPIMLLVGAATLTIRIILDSEFRNSALLYIAVPFVISILLHFFVGRTRGITTTGLYLNHLRDATIVMLATSALLFEGFVCVLMFMPIYYFIHGLGFLLIVITEGYEKSKAKKLGAYGVPIIVALMSLEGVAGPVSFERTSQASYTAVLDQPVSALKANMALPIDFREERHWFLSLFPLAQRVEAGSLKAGDIHKVHFTYKRWFFTNVHQGHMLLKISEVGENRIKTEIVENTSYLASYMRLEGTEVHLTPLAEGKTEVTLTIKYQRLLDPYWYFGPLMDLAARESARYLIQNVIERDPANG